MWKSSVDRRRAFEAIVLVRRDVISHRSNEGEQLAGTVVVAFDGWRAYIYHIAVAPFARGPGLGRALLAEAEADLRTQGARRAYVEMSDANTAGLALCASSGFEPEGDIALVKELHG
jgi:ribosomal protein S18 acetylase RimI-like enzyme